MTNSADQQLVSEFVLTFTKLDECRIFEGDAYPFRFQLAVGDPDEYGYRRWEPIQVATDRSCLDNVYAKLPARFPPLYEQLILSYRWAEVDLRTFTLLANPPGDSLELFVEQIYRDKHLTKILESNGYVRFAKGPDMDYDPICFDLQQRRQNGDFRIVKLDHEEILCNSRIREVAELASSFRDLVLKTIEAAKTLRTP